MKQIISILSVVILFTACKSGDSNKNNDNADLATSIIPYIEGTWVMTDYITDLKTTKSPLASSTKLKGVVSMNITPSMLKNDSLYISGSLNNHEGMGFNIILKQGQGNKQVITDLEGENKSNTYELGYTINGKDTSVILYEYDKDKKEVSKRSFAKVTGPQTEDSEPYSLQYMVNKNLIAGTYNATDDKGKNNEISFTEDGLLMGVDGHKTYFIFTDFIGEEPGYIVDELCFDEQTKDQKPFLYKISADTIRLYEAKENAERTKLSQGALKYTLVKK